MSAMSDRQLMTQDWAPWLRKAPGLVEKLGFCVAIAATPEISAIRFEHKELVTPDLPSNLIHVTNQGQNAFLEAYSQLLEISARTDDMATDGGLLDQVDKMFGDPDAQRACSRILKAIESDVKVCEDNGMKTQVAFEAWKTYVDHLKVAMVSAQRDTNKERNQVIDDTMLLKKEVATHGGIIKHAEMAKNATEQNYKAVLEIHRHREAQLQEYASAAVTYGALKLVPGMLAAAVGAGVYGVLTAKSYDQAVRAEETLERKRQIERELELCMKKMELAMEGLEKEEAGLTEMMNIIISVMSLLEGLSNDIVSLVVFFKAMNTQIKSLVSAHQLHAQTARDLNDDMDQDPDSPLNKYDLTQFHQQLISMKKSSAMINALAGLYADVINSAINPGFAQVMAASYADTSGTKSSLVVVEKHLVMKSYIEAAEQSVVVKSRQAHGELSLKLAAIDEVEAQRASKERKFKARNGAAKRADNASLRSGGSSVSTESRRSRLGRIFGRGS